MVRYVLFGGAGFIGTHFSQTLLESDPTCKVTLVDIRPPRKDAYANVLGRALLNGRAVYVDHDVRVEIDPAKIGLADVVINLAAIHREPGHRPHEYFETNLSGAEHINDYASAVGAATLIFTSSISVYGATEESKSEDSLTVPESPYGSSKLAAEYIHQRWQVASPGRRLLILRPGVVFGPGEGGNVTRLIRSLIRGYFVFVGNRQTRKAGGYVKELCQVALFAMDHQVRTGESLSIINFSSTPTTTLEKFVETIEAVAEISRNPYSIPRPLLVGLSYLIQAVATALRVQQPVSPTRVRKLFPLHQYRSQTVGWNGLSLSLHFTVSF